MRVPTPKPFQVPIVGRICRALDEEGRALVVMATGTGKTLTVGFVIRNRIGEPIPNKRILVLAHLNAILDHLRSEFAKVFTKARVNLVYDGGTVREDSAIVYANFATMRNQIAAGTVKPEDFHTVVVDEGHHAQAGTFREVIEFFKPKDLIGMTATPDRMDRKDIGEIFGEPVVTLTLARAVARRYVANIVYRLMSADGLADEIATLKKEVAEGLRISKREAERRLFQSATDDGFLTLMDELPATTKVLVFVDSIKRAKELAGKVKNAAAYHSEQDGMERARLLHNFRNGTTRRLITIDALNEGVDVPDTDVVVFLRSTESLTIFLQQLGRGLRLVAGKKNVTVYDFVGNVERIRSLVAFLKEVKLERGASESEGTNESNDDAGDHPTVDGASDDDSFDLGDLGSIEADFTPELIDVLKFFSDREKNFYPTLTEAMTAVQSLKIRGSKQYRRQRWIDPRLPPRPETKYPDWTSWTAFCSNRNWYPTLAEASIAARRLDIRSSYKYKTARERDSRLHSTPEAYYPDWTSWPEFLGTVPYATYEEASAAARKLGARNSRQYWKRYSEDPRLRSKPNEIYPEDWKDWPDFLGTTTYPTLAEASEATRRLGIKSQQEYQKRYREDPRLSSSPYSYYPDWTNWPDFHGHDPKKKG